MTTLNELLSHYDYDLPQERIARFPLPERDGGLLLKMDPEGLSDRRITDLPSMLSSGDLLVVNDTSVLPARLYAQRESGGRIEVFYLGQKDQNGFDRVLLRPSRRLKLGERLHLLSPQDERIEKMYIELIASHETGDFSIRSHPNAELIMSAVGEAPIPPYFKRRATPEDASRYQTIFASHPGAVAAPTAGLHLTHDLLSGLNRQGIGVCAITLHVGSGTFRPLQEEHILSGLLHSEPYFLSRAAADQINQVKADGGRIVAVGTTVARTLESVWLKENAICETSGETRLFIRDKFDFRVIDGLLTNFHLPRSSLLMLVSAFAGYDKTMSAYRHAVQSGYRFYSYGDAMLALRRRS